VIMGLFGVSEVLLSLEDIRGGEDAAMQPTPKFWDLFPNRTDWKRSVPPIGRGSLLGFFIGLLPGGTGIVASFASYAIEKKISKHPERFGQGAIEGVAGPESANNSAASASFIPMLTLGIPGNPAIAMIFAALLIQGVTPGPFLIREHPDLFWGVIASMYIGTVLLHRRLQHEERRI
jgi:putative tricarboxylic transport membrane protein